MESQERLSQRYSAAQHLGLSAELNTFLGAFNLVVLSEMITACVNKIDELGVTQSNIFLAVDSIVCKSSPSFLNDALLIHYRLNFRCQIRVTKHKLKSVLFSIFSLTQNLLS